MITYLASVTAPARLAGLSTGTQTGLSLAAVGLLGGIAFGMHQRKKSPRIIGWLCFLVGIPLAGLLSGAIAYITGLTLWSVPVSMIAVGYIGFAFFHDGLGRKGKPHRWLQPVFGLVLPALLLTLGGGLGNGARSVLHLIGHGAGTAITQTTGK